MNLFDAAAAREARDAGIALAASHAPSFIQLGLELISRMEPGMEVQGEDIRAYLIEREIEPRKHQAWGALIQAAVKRGFLIPTGRYEKTRSVKTHAHPTQVYRIFPHERG